MLEMMSVQRRGLEASSLHIAVTGKKAFLVGRCTSFKMQFTELVGGDEKSSVAEKLSRFAGSLSIGQGSNDPFFLAMTMYPPRATTKTTPNPPR